MAFGTDRIGYFEDFGVRFEYPLDWELDVHEDGPRTTVSIQSADGSAFAFLALDTNRPDPKASADEALAAMQDEYPELEARAVAETIDGHHAVGHDVDFFSLDTASSCAIRCLRTPRRTVLIFSQWTDLDAEETESQVRTIRRSFEETDA